MSEYQKELSNLTKIRFSPIQYFNMKKLHIKGLGLWNLFKTIDCYEGKEVDNERTIVIIRHDDNLFCYIILLLLSPISLIFEGLFGFKKWISGIFNTRHKGCYFSKYFYFDNDSIQTKEPYIFLESLLKKDSK